MKINRQVIAGIGLVLMSMLPMAVLFATKRKPNVYDEASWKPVFEFIQSADKVQTVATTFDDFAYDNPPKNLSEFLASKQTRDQYLVKALSTQDRTRFLLDFKKLPHDAEPRAACFCPHHFVFASKGTQTVVIAICFHCSAIWVHGAFDLSSGIRSSDEETLIKAFGINLGPHLNDAPCSFNAGSGNV